MAAIKRIAMWSGPRNISTAMMRSWGNRSDTFVTDEPLYAHFLLKTGLPHPGASEVIAHHESDWRKVVAWLTGPIPREGPRIWYQKHMTHHLLPEITRDWLNELSHAFLIRQPREMLCSLVKHIPNPTLEDTGLPQQAELFQELCERSGSIPPVIDASDVLRDPRGSLIALCEALDVPFEENMLHWQAGRRATDGIWARHWYSSVEKSTTFERQATTTVDLEPVHASLLAECDRLYAQLERHRLGH